ncbi:MAG: hypothetical protein AVDCRST_MAG93-6582 [uncultured Chloroflexia bacterium]|uniref:Uncharacterized protein n=1 Tax=uncultured Chloroflexia bacterium TaxID=1672391 RepID=A0A6J4LTT6_9CHLR|nr:MAG: hypothetical protein AVDCRST_MAG93-6582 [uncultured Chloroflexia bacterium]
MMNCAELRSGVAGRDDLPGSARRSVLHVHLGALETLVILQLYVVPTPASNAT